RDLFAVGLDATARLLDDASVDPHDARLDQRVARTTRPDPARGEQLVEADSVQRTSSLPTTSTSDSASDSSSSLSSSSSSSSSDRSLPVSSSSSSSSSS